MNTRPFTGSCTFGLLGALCFLGLGCDPGTDQDLVEETQSNLSFENLPGQNTPFITDWGTACPLGFDWAHCCPTGMVMTGAHLGYNAFKCANFKGGLEDILQIDHATNRNNMHACPFGSLMVGYHRGYNVLFCRRPHKDSGQVVVAEQVDGATSDGFMHVCPQNNITNPGRFAMSGINAGSNKFTCAR